VEQYGKYSLFVGRVMVVAGTETEVRVSWLIVHSVAKRGVRFPVDVNIKERKMAVSFCLHSEHDVLMDTTQMAKEVNQIAWAMWPEDKCVIHIAKPAEEHVCYHLHSHFFQVFHEEVGNDW
jgi:hypothetical protein